MLICRFVLVFGIAFNAKKTHAKTPISSIILAFAAASV